MFKAALPIVLAASLLAVPSIAQAQSAAQTAAQSSAGKDDYSMVIRPGQWIAIGAGAVTGFVVGEALFSTDLGMVVGGLVGGYLANVLYQGYQIEVRMGMAAK